MKRHGKFLAGTAGLLIGVLCGVASGQQYSAYPGSSTGWVPVGTPTGGAATASSVPVSATSRTPTVSTAAAAPGTAMLVSNPSSAPGVASLTSSNTASTAARPVSTGVSNAAYTGSAPVATGGVLPTSATMTAAPGYPGSVVPATGYIPSAAPGTGVTPTSATASGAQNRINQQFGLPTVQLASRPGYESIAAPAPLGAYPGGDVASGGYSAPSGYGMSNAYGPATSGYGATPYTAQQTGYSTAMPYQSAYPGGSPYVEYTDAGYASGISNGYGAGQVVPTGYASPGYATGGYSSGEYYAGGGVCGDVGCDTGYTGYGAYTTAGPMVGYDPGFLTAMNPFQGLPCVLSFGFGSEAFRSPLDGMRSGNIGLRETLNLGGALLPGYGIGYQIGIAGFQGNFGGNSSPLGGPDGDRDQFFVTAGVFRRNAFRGFQGGVVWDYMRDNYFQSLDANSVRAELSFRVNPQFDFGYNGLFNTGKSDYVIDAGGNAGEFQLATTHIGFLRWTFINGANARVGGGATDDGDGIVNTALTVPISPRLALDTQCFGLFPKEKEDVWGMRNNAWGLGLQLVWYPGRGSYDALQGQYNPVHNVAGNMTHFYTRKSN